jgi:hypothetical protein
MAGQIYVAKNSFVYEEDGMVKHVPQGATIRAGHPLLKGREGFFSPLVIDFDLAEPTPPSPRKGATG